MNPQKQKRKKPNYARTISFLFKLKKVYIGDEIEVYGIQALFCEIPGTLPSNNANPESFTFISGGACYNYFSQRKYLDPTDSDYVGDEESQKYRKLQINKKFDLF